MTRKYKTKYYGIYVQHHEGNYFLQTDNGDEDFISNNYPTEEQIDTFRNAVCRF